MTTPLPDVERILLAANPRNDRCGQAAASLKVMLEKSGLTVGEAAQAGDVSPADLLVVLGGDGFLMHTLNALGYPSIAVFGLNYGQVGFLMNRPEHARDIAAMVREKQYHLTELPILEAHVAGETGEECVHAINDFVLERVSGQTSRLDVYIEGVLLNRYSGDGLIVATATGSTAYTLAAGGPVVHPGLHGLIVTPVNAHRPIQFHSLQFPLVLPLDSTVKITVADRDVRPTRLVADGSLVGRPRSVTIGSSRRSIHLIRTKGFSYISALVDKVIGNNGA